MATAAKDKIEVRVYGTDLRTLEFLARGNRLYEFTSERIVLRGIPGDSDFQMGSYSSLLHLKELGLIAEFQVHRAICGRFIAREWRITAFGIMHLNFRAGRLPKAELPR